MKSLKINSLLAISFVTGLLVSGNVTASAQGQPVSLRDCARQMCMMMRNCGGNGQVPDVARKPDAQKKNAVEKASSENTQATPIPNNSCRMFAFQSYIDCAGFGAVKPQDKTAPTNTKK